MHRARDQVDNEQWLGELQRAADALDLDGPTRTAAEELFLTAVPSEDRSKRAALAASLYAAGLVAGDQRSQGEVADAMDVSRISVQGRWKDLLEEAGLDAPDW